MSARAAKVLVVNPGSASLKFEVIASERPRDEFVRGRKLVKGVVEPIGGASKLYLFHGDQAARFGEAHGRGQARRSRSGSLRLPCAEIHWSVSGGDRRSGGGIGENTPEVRRRICQGLEWLGLDFDPQLNDATVDREGRFTREGSRLQAWVIPTQEGLMIGAPLLLARSVAAALCRPSATLRLLCRRRLVRSCLKTYGIQGVPWLPGGEATWPLQL